MDLNLLADSITDLNLSQPPITSEAEREYFRYYRINFAERYRGVTHHFGRIQCGNYDIACHYFAKQGATAHCFVLHGYYDHVGLYRHLIDYCLQHNISVISYDLPGHGLSGGDRGSIDSFDEYTAVLDSVTGFFADVLGPNTYAVAQSTGAAIVMDYLLSRSDPVFSKVVLLAPLVRPFGWRQSLWLYYLVKWLLKTWPRTFVKNSNDPMFLDFLEHHDPLQSRVLPVCWVTALKQWIGRFELLDSNTEIAPLVVQGESDTTVDWRYNLKAIKTKFPQLQVQRLPEARHHLVNESQDIRAQIWSALDQYFDNDH